MRPWVLLAIAAACGGDKKPKRDVREDAGLPADAARVTGDADRDRLFLAVPTARAALGIVERLAAQPHVAGTKANEAVAKEIMRTLGRMGWRLGTQQYDVYLPHPKRLAIRAGTTEIAVTEPDEPPVLTWNAYSASGKVRAALVEDLARAKGKILLLPFGAPSPGAQVAAAERAGAAAVIFYPAEPDRPADTPRRETVLYAQQRPGDPLTPGVAALPGAPRARPREVDVLPKIPVVTVAAAEAAELRAAKGPIEVAVDMDGETRPIRDIIAILEGGSQEAVILGNHYDAWGSGAIDPHTGTAALIEIARGLTALTRAGWRPRRTIILAFWDAAEPGAIGSTEWVEENLEMLRARGVAYLDVDAVTAGELVVQGSPALRAHVRACAGDVTNPATGQPFAPVFEDLGIGSDATAFLHHAGIASLQWSSGAYHVRHSLRDDLEHARLADPGFAFVPAVAQVMGLCAIRLADADHLPLDYGATADWLAAALDAVTPPDRPALDAALGRLREAALHAAAQPRKAGGDPARCNGALAVAERGFLDPGGLAGRPWYRHLATGPDPETGGALRVPELAAAKTERARRAAAERLATAIDRVAAVLAPCR